MTSTRESLRATLVALCAVLGASLTAPASAQGSLRPAGAVQLSDERERTRWAYPTGRHVIYARPLAHARVTSRLRMRTEDRRPEVYVALVRWRDAGGDVWIKIRVPGRPNGQTGWVRRAWLGRLRLVRTRLVVNRRTLRATLYRRGKKVWHSHVGVGKRRTPTPAGHFYVRERLSTSGQAGGLYGPVAFGTSAYARVSDWPRGGIVGIHGTNRPGLIPGRPSHGCVRVPNREIRRLSRLMPVGTPVRIR